MVQLGAGRCRAAARDWRGRAALRLRRCGGGRGSIVGAACWSRPLRRSSLWSSMAGGAYAGGRRRLLLDDPLPARRPVARGAAVRDRRTRCRRTDCRRRAKWSRGSTISLARPRCARRRPAGARQCRVGRGQRRASRRAGRHPPLAAPGLRLSRASVSASRSTGSSRRPTCAPRRSGCRRRPGRAAAIRPRRARRAAGASAPPASGPAIRRPISWRSPAKVSECQSIERKRPKQYPIALDPGARQQRAQQLGRGSGQGCALIIARLRGKRGPVYGPRRGSRPLRRSNTKRGSRIASRPKRAAEIWLSAKEFFDFAQ